METAQDFFIAVVDDADVEEEGKYLDEPEQRYQAVLLAYGAYKKKAITDEQEMTAKLLEDNEKIEENRRTKDVENAREVEIARIKAEKEIMFNSTKMEFNLAKEAFSKSNNGFRGVIKEASDHDKRRVFEKLEDDFYLLQKKLVALGSIDPLMDTKEFQEKFEINAETPFSESRK